MANPLYDILTSNGYYDLRIVPNRGICGIQRFLFTTGLCYGLDDESYQGRYCFGSNADAREALANWDGTGDPSGDWIKHKGRSGEYSNKNLNKNENAIQS